MSGVWNRLHGRPTISVETIGETSLDRISIDPGECSSTDFRDILVIRGGSQRIRRSYSERYTDAGPRRLCRVTSVISSPASVR